MSPTPISTTHPAAPSRTKGFILGLLAACLLIAIAPPAATAAPPFFSDFANSGDPATGQVLIPRGIAADPANGEIFVSDQGHDRINVYSAWGEFLRTWGWDVVASGPGDTAADELETCVPAEGDTCQAGIRGSGPGQLSAPQGLDRDSSGDIYVIERPNERIEKFSPDGEFLLMFGGGVNQGGGTPENPGNLCTAAHLANGDTCGAGTSGTGPGEFDVWPFPAQGGSAFIAVSPADDVYVGDADRIQIFDTSGTYQSEVDLTGSLDGFKVGALDVDSSGNLYASFIDSGILQPDIHKLDPAGNVLATFTVNEPGTVTVAPDGDVYSFDADAGFEQPQILRFAPDTTLAEAFDNSLGNSSGIAVSPVTSGGDLAVYIANSVNRLSGNPLIRAYSPVPDQAIVGPPPSVPPAIVDSFASQVGTETATLEAEINPRFWDDATYHVEYGTDGPCSSSPCQQAPATPVALTAQVVSTPLPAQVTLGGLDPATTYHYRFTSTSSGGGPAFGPDLSFTTYPLAPGVSVGCPNQALRTGPSALLPDCRAYEMVSPVDKNGGDISAPLNISSVEQMVAQATPEGSKLTYSSRTAFADPDGAPFVSQYLASRGAGGWSTDAITPAREVNIAGLHLNNQFRAFSTDLSQAWLFWDGEPPLDPAVPPGYKMLYRRDNASGAYSPLITVTPPAASPGTVGDDHFNPRLAGFSADGKSAVFTANDRLVPQASTATNSQGRPIRQLYEWREGQGIGLVSILPSEVSILPSGSASDQSSMVGSSQSSGVERSANAVSADGSVIWWTTGSGVGGGARIYARVDGSQTVAVSEEVSADDASFQAASTDGGRALFRIDGELYLFELQSEDAVQIATGVLGVVGASEDLTNAYLVSTDVLDPDPNSEGDTAQAGESNVFHWAEGEGFTYAATLTGEAEVDAGGSAPGIAHSGPHGRVSRVTPDGRHLAFVSRAPLTGYDNTDAIAGNRVSEVFWHSVDTGELRCASCNPSGARPLGAEIFPFRGNPSMGNRVAATIRGHENGNQTTSWHAKRVLSEDGRSLFFESFDSLLPRDGNGQMDVYQWQAPGTANCDSDNQSPGPLYFSENEGCLSLISTGTDPGHSDFIDATPDGSTAFLRTSQSLVRKDAGLTDIYAARVGGGHPEAPPAPAPCEGEACRGASPASPPPAGAGTAAFEGAGNPAPAPPDRCARLARAAQRHSRTARRMRSRARRLVRAAKRTGRPRAARAARRKAKRLTGTSRKRAKAARRGAKRAKRCRRARANANRRASR